MYNKVTARNNQIKFLEAQMCCGFANIEKAARKSYENIMKAIAEEERINAIAERVAKARA